MCRNEQEMCPALCAYQEGDYCTGAEPSEKRILNLVT